MRILLYGAFVDYQMELARALNSNGIDTRVVLLVDSLSDEIEDLYSDIDYTLLIKPKQVINPRNYSILRRYKRQLMEIDPDVIHLQLGGTLIDSYFLPVFRKYPLVSTFHDVKLHKGERSIIVETIRYFERMFSTQVIVHGEFLKEQMMKTYGLNQNKIHTIQMGEHEVKPFMKYRRKEAAAEDYSILFFGRLYDYKGLDVLFKAQPLISEVIPEARFIVAGGGQDVSRYSHHIVDNSKFEIYNYRIPYEQGAELFQRCSLVVLPYIEASQSGVIPTAYGFKKPVIATSVGSIPEIVDNGVTGIIIPPRDPVQLAAAVVKLLKDDNARRTMGENAFVKLKKDFSWDNIVKKTIWIYEKALEEKVI